MNAWINAYSITGFSIAMVKLFETIFQLDQCKDLITTVKTALAVEKIELLFTKFLPASKKNCLLVQCGYSIENIPTVI